MKSTDKLRIQLKWVHQAQFAGIYVAMEKGYFNEEGLDVSLLQGGPGINVDQKVNSGEAEIGVSSFDSLLVSRNRGLPLISVAQIVQRSTQGLVTKRSSNIKSPSQMNGKRIGTFGGTNSYQLAAFLNKFQLEEEVEIVLQTSIDNFLDGTVDVGSITVYNELQKILSSGIKLNEINIFPFSQYEVGFVEDTIIVKEHWLKENRSIAERAVRAIIRGWQYAILNKDKAIKIVMKYVDPTTTTKELQRLMLRSISHYIVPPGFSTSDIGTFQLPGLWHTANVLYRYNLISKPANIHKAIDWTIA